MLSVFDNSSIRTSAHDVAVACRLAMAEVRVQLPLGVSEDIHSGVPELVAGIGLLIRSGVRPTAGSSPATGAFEVRNGRVKPMGDGTPLEPGRALLP